MASPEKKAQTEERTIVFVDESGFYLLPAAVYTWAPKRETPVLKSAPWVHLSVISGITPSGKLYTRIQDTAFTGQDVTAFLKHLLRLIPGPLIVIWDGLPAHRSQAVKRLLQDGATNRLHLEPLPAYAPDLNPDEGVWNYLKNVEMRNLCCQDRAHLRTELAKAIRRLRNKKTIIQSFFRQAGLDPFV